MGQHEKAFQKQRKIFINRKASLPKKRGGRRALRYFKEVGLGFKTPADAINGNYIDNKCPFTSGVIVRGRILTGVIKKMKMTRTCVVRRDYLNYIKKYNRFEKRHKNISCHISPAFPDASPETSSPSGSAARLLKPSS